MLCFYPEEIATEIINIFAKHKIPIFYKDSIYKKVDDLLELQIVQPKKLEVNRKDEENEH